MERVNAELKKYVELNILPVYQNFDKGHNITHIIDVTQRAIDLYGQLKEKFNLDINMIFVVATYHDIGMQVQREKHSYYSKKILLSDDNLKKWFNQKQIETMADAVEDHSTSISTEPRTVYGKIISDADKDLDVDKGILRGYNFSLKNFKNFTLQQHIENVYAEIVKRFADGDIGGKNLVNFYFPNKKTDLFYNSMRNYAYNNDLFKEKILELISKTNK